MYQPGVPEESFPASELTQIPQKRETGSFLGPCSSMMRNDGGKKEARVHGGRCWKAAGVGW